MFFQVLTVMPARVASYCDTAELVIAGGFTRERALVPPTINAVTLVF
jgi:hypothetical protein